MSNRSRADRWRIAIVTFKFATGGLELAFGTTILILSVAGLQNLVDRLTAHELRQDPNDPIVLFIQHHLAGFLHNKVAIGIALLALGAVKVIGAVGLLRHKPWAYYLLVGLLVVVLPFDVAHLISDLSPVKAVLAALNIAVLAVLLIYRKPLISREERGTE